MSKQAKTKERPQIASDEEREVPQAEKDVVGKLLSEIDRAKTIRKKFDTESLPKLRRYVWGTHDSDANKTRTNLIFATIATLLPHIYAKNPEISVAPTEAVGKDEYKQIKEFCKTAQVMLNNLFIEEGQLKRRMKSNARAAMTTSVGWIKMSFQESLSGDPIIVRRANDVQDNLRRIEYLVSCSKVETDTTKLNQQREELANQLTAMMDSPEMKVYKGLVLDRVKTEDVFILDESIVEFDDYVSAKKLDHRIYMTDEEYYETFGHKVPKGAAQYGQPAPGELADETGQKIEIGGDASKASYRAVHEVWDRTSNTICCVCEGCAGYARAPYVLKPAAERWYSFFALGFNIVEGRWRPLSDVELLRQLQDEYNTTRFLFAETRKESIPTRVFRKSGNLTEEDIKALTERKARDWIGVEGNPSQPLENDIMQLDGIKIDPAAFDVTIIRNDMDMLVGLSDASRSNLIQAKTATEAEIMRQALMTRVAERQDTIEDLTSEMASAALQIFLQKFKLDEVKQIVGEGAVWPELSIEETFRKVRVSVRAGSTGKPNILKERESWAAIMPIINDTITQVMELRAAGQFDLANSKIELLKETLTRYDEKIDVDRFIPEQEMDENGQPTAQQNAIAQAQQVAEQNKTLQEELQKSKEALLKAQAGEQSTVAKMQADQAIATAQASAKEAEANAKAATAAADAEAKYAADVEKARIAAQSEEKQNADKLAAEKEMHTATLANQKAIAEISASGKIKAASAKKLSGNGETQPDGVEAEPAAEDNEYQAMAEVLMQQGQALQQQTAALGGLAQAFERLAAAQGASRELTVTTSDGRELKGRSRPVTLNS